MVIFHYNVCFESPLRRVHSSKLLRHTFFSLFGGEAGVSLHCCFSCSFHKINISLETINSPFVDLISIFVSISTCQSMLHMLYSMVYGQGSIRTDSPHSFFDLHFLSLFYLSKARSWHLLKNQSFYRTTGDSLIIDRQEVYQLRWYRFIRSLKWWDEEGYNILTLYHSYRRDISPSLMMIRYDVIHSMSGIFSIVKWHQWS